MDKVKHYINENNELIIVPSSVIESDRGVFLEFIVAEDVNAWDTMSFSENIASYVYELPNDGLFYYYRLHIPRKSELQHSDINDDGEVVTTFDTKGKLYYDDYSTKYEIETTTTEVVTKSRKRLTFLQDVDSPTGYKLEIFTMQKLDEDGLPVVDENNEPVYIDRPSYASKVEEVPITTETIIKKVLKVVNTIEGSGKLIYNKNVAGTDTYKDYEVGAEDTDTTITLETLLGNINNTDYGLLEHSYIVDENEIYVPNYDVLAPVPIFSIHYIEKCLDYYEKKAIKEQCSSLKGSCKTTSNNKERDFLIVSHFLLERLVLEHKYEEAQKIIDFISECGAPCSAEIAGSPKSSDCGCGGI